MKKAIQAILGLAIGGFLLWFLFRGVSWMEFRASLAKMHPGWFLLAQIPLAASFVARIQRWTYIVRVSNPGATFRHLFSATQIGFLGNFVLPARAGEVMRAVSLARLSRMPVSRAFAMCALDRVTDLFGLIVTMGITILAFTPTQDVAIPAALLGLSQDYHVPATIIRQGVWATGAVLLVMVVVMTAVYAAQGVCLRLSDKIIGLVSTKAAAKIRHLLEQFLHGMLILSSGHLIVKSLLWSLLTWVCFIACSWLLILAFGISCPWYAPLLLQSCMGVAVSLPGAPGGVGQVQIATVAALRMAAPETSFSDALALGVVLHILNFVYVAILGVYSLYLEGFSLMELQRQGEAARGELDEEERDMENVIKGGG